MGTLLFQRRWSKIASQTVKRFGEVARGCENEDFRKANKSKSIERFNARFFALSDIGLRARKDHMGKNSSEHWKDQFLTKCKNEKKYKLERTYSLAE